MSNSNARQRRIYRARAANFLSTLDSTCSVEELLTIDWVALESLPHWCFLDAAEKQRVQLLCGALFLAPMIQRWIDGPRIQSLRALIGAVAYQSVLEFAPHAGQPDGALLSDQNTPDIESMLLDAGAAVCLGAIQHPVIANLLLSQFEHRRSLAADIAQPLYTSALALYDHLQAGDTSAAMETTVMETMA